LQQVLYMPRLRGWKEKDWFDPDSDLERQFVTDAQSAFIYLSQRESKPSTMPALP
jgi:hypothetical protein